MKDNNLNYYNFLHKCGKNSRSIQWLWSTPDDIIAKKLAGQFPDLDKKILEAFLKNLKYIKKEKKKKNSEKTPLAIIRHLKTKKELSKLNAYNIGQCNINQRKATEIFINYSLCLKNNELSEVKQHELCHAKFEYADKHYPSLNNISDAELTAEKISKPIILGRLDELFRNEFLAYIVGEKKFRIVLDHQVNKYVDENYIHLIYNVIHENKMKKKKIIFNSYYKTYLKLLRKKPLYYYLTFHEFNQLKKKYPKTYTDHFFNLLAPISSAQYIAQTDRKKINKYRTQQKQFISNFYKKACSQYTNDPNDIRIKNTYKELLNEQTLLELHFFNSPKLLKPLLLIFCTLSMDEDVMQNESLLNNLFALIIQSYHYQQSKNRHRYKPLILKLIRIKKRYLPADEIYSSHYLNHFEKLLKNSYI